MNKNSSEHTTARLASLDELIQSTIPLFITPVPTKATLRTWFEAAKIPRFKPNPLAQKGGGQVYFSVSHVEKFFRSRTLIV